MKTKQTKIDRSAAKWLPGAMALAATTASSQAAIVQITLFGNKISSLGGNSLNADLTGDSIDDLEIFVASVNAGGRVRVGAYHLGWVTCQGGPNYRAQPRFSSSGLIPGFGDPFVEGESPLSAYGLNCINFKDQRINGGQITAGMLEVHAFNGPAANDNTVQFTRLIFDDESFNCPELTSIPGVQTEWQVSAVPEPSSFALLALGAGGLLARRRRQAKVA